MNLLFQELSEPWGFTYFQCLRRSSPVSQKECFNWKEIAAQSVTPSSAYSIFSLPSSRRSLSPGEGDHCYLIVSTHLMQSTGQLCQSNSHYSQGLDQLFASICLLQVRSLLFWLRLTSPLIYGFKHRYLEGKSTDTSHPFQTINSSCFVTGACDICGHRLWLWRIVSDVTSFLVAPMTTVPLFHHLVSFAWDVCSIAYRN